MKTLKQILDKAIEGGRGTQDLAKKELLDVLEVIAQDILERKTTVLHAHALLGIRSSWMNEAERILDTAKAEAELSEMAAALGKKGGESISEAKAKASRENGKKGGRPKGSKKKEGG